MITTYGEAREAATRLDVQIEENEANANTCVVRLIEKPDDLWGIAYLLEIFAKRQDLLGRRAVLSQQWGVK